MSGKLTALTYGLLYCEAASFDKIWEEFTQEYLIVFPDCPNSLLDLKHSILQERTP